VALKQAQQAEQQEADFDDAQAGSLGLINHLMHYML